MGLLFIRFHSEAIKTISFWSDLIDNVTDILVLFRDWRVYKKLWKFRMIFTMVRLFWFLILQIRICLTFCTTGSFCSDEQFFTSNVSRTVDLFERFLHNSQKFANLCCSYSRELGHMRLWDEKIGARKSRETVQYT